MTLDPPDYDRILTLLGAERRALGQLMDAHDAAADGSFPEEAWELLARTGATSAIPGAVPSAGELELVRAVARIDVSLGRILDGHLNGLSRLASQVDDQALATADLARAREGRLRLGVWGAEPGIGEGEPAYLTDKSGGAVLTGVKTFCSGAGGLDRAFVLTRFPGEPPIQMAYVDLHEGVAVDDGWFRGAGMRGSASHRVEFDETPVLWRASTPGALLEQPYMAGDAIRTAASWAGGADIAVDELLILLRAKEAIGDLEALAITRVSAEQRTIGLWLDGAAEVLGDRSLDGAALATMAVEARSAIAEAIRRILDDAGRIAGSRSFATGARLERARRDLDTYLLQHRLEPLMVKSGRRVLEGYDAGSLASARVDPAGFEDLYSETIDPWDFAHSAYEQEKYARTIAALDGRRFPRALELGCSIGVLTEALVARADELVALDASPTALASARERLAGIPNVTLLEATLPESLPAGPWDLIVASEVLYYFDADLLDRFVGDLEKILAPGATLLAVHWTDEAPDHLLSGDQVHELLLGRPGLRWIAGEREPGYRIDRFERQ